MAPLARRGPAFFALFSLSFYGQLTMGFKAIQSAYVHIWTPVSRCLSCCAESHLRCFSSEHKRLNDKEKTARTTWCLSNHSLAKHTHTLPAGRLLYFHLLISHLPRYSLVMKYGFFAFLFLALAMTVISAPAGKTHAVSNTNKHVSNNAKSTSQNTKSSSKKVQSGGAKKKRVNIPPLRPPRLYL